MNTPDVSTASEMHPEISGGILRSNLFSGSVLPFDSCFMAQLFLWRSKH